MDEEIIKANLRAAASNMPDGSLLHLFAWFTILKISVANDNRKVRLCQD